MKDALMITEDILKIQYQKCDEYVQDRPHSSVVIGAFTTTYARLKLYSLLDMLQERLLYCDTDSVIFISKPGLPEPQLGRFVGELTDEIKSEFGSEWNVTRFCSAGPKNYSFELFNPQTNQYQYKIKVKEICLNFASSQVINFDTMKAAVFDNYKTRVDQVQFRVSPTLDVITKPTLKTYQLVFDKRQIQHPSFETLPFGFQHP